MLVLKEAQAAAGRGERGHTTACITFNGRFMAKDRPSQYSPGEPLYISHWYILPPFENGNLMASHPKGNPLGKNPTG